MRKDAVTPEVRAHVLQRDGVCFLYRIDGDHQCSDRYGPHDPFDTSRLTVDHVHDGGGMMGKRAPSDPQHLTAMCWRGNFECPSHAVREKQREYLKGFSCELP